MIDPSPLRLLSLHALRVKGGRLYRANWRNLMTYKTILVHVDNSERALERIRIAIELAQTHDAHLVGLATVGMIALSNTYGLDGTPAYMAEALADMEGIAAMAAERFDAKARAAGLSSYESRVHRGDPTYEVCTDARYADLVVLGQTEPSQSTAATPEDLPETVMLSCGRPVLIIPYAGHFRTLGRRVMFLWNASRESARAASDALPFFTRADEVRVSVFDAKANMGGHGDEPGSDVATYLARQGATVTVNRDTSSGEVGSSVLSRANDFDADLIVMGGYGHTRLREWVLGGVSKTLLEHMTVPVLMSH